MSRETHFDVACAMTSFPFKNVSHPQLFITVYNSIQLPLFSTEHGAPWNSYKPFSGSDQHMKRKHLKTLKICLADGRRPRADRDGTQSHSHEFLVIIISPLFPNRVGNYIM